MPGRMETKPQFGQVGQVLRFGSFEVNLSTGELRKRGIRLPMQEQPLRILAALAERPGEVVSREDLCRRLWPGGTFVDFEHSLNAAVRRLRVALGDEAETPRFIETVHRRGYRFLAWSQTFPRIEEASRLAVLPFISFDGGDAHRVFSDGLTEETITQLARACPAHIGVIARTSVMRLRGSEQSAAEIGRVLGADYLVEGSIRREGNRLRIVAQLIESRDETHLWAATFDRVMGDELTLQADVAEQIAREVAGVLSGRAPLVSREAAS
jgi:TolB-like protein